MSNVLRPAFGGRPAAAPAEDPDATFDTEVTSPPPPPPADDGDRHGGGGGKGGRGGKEPPHFGPVIPLGVCTLRGGTGYVFLDAAGLRTTLSAQQMRGPAWIAGLFGGADGRELLTTLWPRWEIQRDASGKPIRDADGKPVFIQGSGFSAGDAGDALIAACNRVGHAAAVELRRDGVWPHSDGGLIVHCGDRIISGAESHRPGFRDGRAIYVSAELRPPPADQPATVAECLALEEDLRLWTYAVPEAGPALLMGLIACGILGAAAPWRPHVFVRAPEGSGKSTLNRLISAACGAEEPSTDTSEAGLRRLADGRSGLLPLDEKEANARGVAAVVDLMRGASDGRGAVVIRAAGEGGGADVFRVVGCFLLTAITQPKLTAADVSRITLVELRPLERDRSKQAAEATARAAALFPALVKRLLLGWDRWQANWRAARAAVLAQEATSRSADQLGALIAGWQVLVSDDPLSEADAARLVEPLVEFLTTRSQAEEIGTPRRVLQHLLPSRVQVGLRSSETTTVQNALQAALAAFGAADDARRNNPTDPLTGDLERKAKAWRRRLGALGLRLMLGPERDAWPGRGPPAPGLWVRNGSPAVEALFSGTEWAGGAWEGPLRDLPGAQKSKTSMKFAGGGQDRAVFLPAELLGLDDTTEGDLE